jgi:fructose-specific phosphotransferase system IIC component
MEEIKKQKISVFSIVITAGAIYILFTLFGSILYNFQQNQYLAFSIMMGIPALIAGILIGLQKNTKRIPTSIIAAIVTSILYFITSVPSRAADLNMFTLIFLSATIPMVLATWLVATLKKQ